MTPTQRIRASLAGTPEHVAGYLNSRAADDIAWLLDEVDAARERIALLRAEVADMEHMLLAGRDRGAT